MRTLEQHARGLLSQSLETVVLLFSPSLGLDLGCPWSTGLNACGVQVEKPGSSSENTSIFPWSSDTNLALVVTQDVAPWWLNIQIQEPMEGRSNLLHHTQSALFLGGLCILLACYHHRNFIDPGFHEHHFSLWRSRHILIPQNTSHLFLIF